MKHAERAAKFGLVPKCKPNTLSGVQHVFSVDVEEWFQVGAFENALTRKDWSSLESRVDYQTNIILDLLAQNDVSASFFCLGWVAQRSPSLIQRISDAGHEVACHGMDHKRLYQMSTKEFAVDIHNAKKLLEDACGNKVIGYRAPSFSMSEKTWDFYSQMIEAGFLYSSSVFPAKTDHYGMPSAPRLPFFPVNGSDFIEVPMTVAEVGPVTAPASGGGYFRLLPSFVSRFLMGRAYRQTSASMIFYMHPWEVDPDQPRVENAPLLSKIRHYSRQSSMKRKLDTLMKETAFTRLDMLLIQEYGMKAIHL